MRVVLYSDTTIDLSDWLYCPGSLTEQLKKQVGNVELHILSQIWKRQDYWLEMQEPGLQFPVMQREIIISSDSKPCWFSRSYFSKALYNNQSWLIARMQNEPLGHILFTDPRIERVAFHVMRISQDDAPWRWTGLPLIQEKKTAMMRFARYRVLEDEGLWVSELFLQGLHEVL